MNIFEFEDYREFVRRWVASQRKAGYGQYRRIALRLRIAPVTISQVFKGDRDLPLEAALPLAEFMELGGIERRYFVKLVQLSHAGTPALRQIFLDELEKIKSESLQLKNRVPTQVRLSSENLAVFHSSWTFSAVRLLTSIEGFQTPRAIAEKLSLSLESVEQTLQFLTECGLCVFENDLYRMGPARTHLPDDSPFVVPRQMSWRSRAAVRMTQPSPDELFYTAPMTIATKDLASIKLEILKLIDKVGAVVGPSTSEELVCLNIDWFKVAPSEAAK